jgi:hypothetical protein
MRRIRHAWHWPALLVAIVACATAQPRLATPSGRPEVTIAGATRQAVANHIANSAATGGFTIAEMTDTRVRVEKAGGLGESLLAGSRFNAIPVYRYTYTLLDADGGVRVLADAELVTNPASAFEKRTNLVQGKPAQQLQESLEKMRESFARPGTTPQPPESP